MSNYTKTTDFEAKDSLPSGDSGKIIRGSEFETEFDNIATAIATKADAADPTFTGTVTIDGLTVNGNTTLGNAATDTVTVTADIASNLIPSADDTYNLGASGAEWNDLYVDGVAYIDTINGFATTGNVTFGDNDKAIFGAGSDLEIYHDGSHSYIEEKTSGNFYIKGANLFLQSTSGDSYAYFSDNGAARLYYDNVKKFETTSTGIDITGNATFGDNGKAIFGAGSDLQIYHDGSNSYIADTGTGLLQLRTNGSEINITGQSGSEFMARFQQDGAVKLYYDSAQKLATSSTGIDVTGTVTADGLTVDGSSAGRVTSAEFKNNLNAGGTEVAINLANQGGTNNADVNLVANRVGANFGSDFYIETSDGVDGTNRKRFNIGENGDISFYEDTGTTAKFFWDASAERLGIGTSSPANLLHVKGASSGALDLARFRLEGATNNPMLKIEADEANQTAGIDVSGSTTTELTFSQGGIEAMRIDSAGNVGIGTTSPSSALDVAGIVTTDGLKAEGSNVNAVINNTSTSSRGTLLFQENGVTKALVQMRGSADAALPNTMRVGTDSGSTADLLLMTNGNERTRITSGGHLLVGKTAQDSTNTVGFEAKDTGEMAATADGTAAGYFNRKTSDGTIAEFRKDNTSIGSIGTISAGLYIGNSDVGLRFLPSLESIEPFNVGTGGPRDNGIDLGRSASRFKDLYLSGGAYLGGTAAANKLDDYEEGTWTPVMSGSTSGTFSDFTAAARYTKVGRAVHVTCYLQNIDITTSAMSGNIRITGLPFASSATGQQVVSVTYTNIWSFDETDVSIGGYIGGTTFNFMKGSSTTAITDSDEGTNTNGVLMFGITYHV